jgi:NADH:ubiquinone oxidoreductase subunit 2 (subunit N)
MCESVEEFSQGLVTYKGTWLRFHDISLIISIFSLIGIPPLAGFFGKVFVIEYLIQLGSHYILFAVIIILLSVVGSFYYLVIIKKLLVSWKEVRKRQQTDTYVKTPSFALLLLQAFLMLLNCLFFFWSDTILAIINLIIK